jgi:hypothetical protein
MWASLALLTLPSVNHHLALASAATARPPVPQSDDSRQDNSIRLAQAFLAALGPALQAKAVFPFNHPARLKWKRSPGVRNGLSVGEMSNPQRVALHNLLRSVLSTQGYLKAAAIMLNEDILGKHEEGLGSRYFWVAVYGDPAKQDPWGWRIEGHHLSLHFTYVNGKLISSTPLFMGIDPALETEEPERAGLRVLADKEDLARALIKTLNEQQRAQAVVASQVSKELQISELAGRIAFDKPLGLPLAKLSEAQKTIFFKLLEEYVGDLKSEIAAAQRQWIKSFSQEKVYFAWAGHEADGHKEHYYRLQSPEFLIEYYNYGNHVHSVWRTVEDFGAALDRSRR